MMEKLNVIISGGGTGGHIFPAISIANGIKEINPNANILFVGATGRMEMERVPAAGYRIIGIPAQGLKRPLYHPHNLKVALDYFRCKIKARRIIKEFKPDVIVGVGGYASAAIVGVAAKSGLPTLLQEQNSFAGIVNRSNGKYADKICVAYDGMERFFPKEKIMITGNPIRKDITKSTPQMREEAYRFYNLDPGKKTIFVVGGSLGCRTLNECMKKEISTGNLFSSKELGSCQVIWQCGKFYKEEVDEFMKGQKEVNVNHTDFIQRMDLAYAAADIVISRAGAGTISELCVAGKCTIFVPSPNVAEDHQTHNAMALVHKYAAMMVKDSDAINELFKTVKGLLNNPAKIQEMERNIITLGKKDAAHVIAKECIKLSGLKK
ncbi:MAG: undecaprenyldiphospho-muramoylpentapeptide beta-N-acetylglucosaminyltransferase [Bacteroidales bacterium]|nr:undecaprenyldiphospho-muramoylpentapeptide beta-N-acetylglucosaminyltransferase [Bacteroidales bacterium]